MAGRGGRAGPGGGAPAPPPGPRGGAGAAGGGAGPRGCWSCSYHGPAAGAGAEAGGGGRCALCGAPVGAAPWGQGARGVGRALAGGGLVVGLAWAAGLAGAAAGALVGRSGVFFLLRAGRGAFAGAEMALRALEEAVLGGGPSEPERRRPPRSWLLRLESSFRTLMELPVESVRGLLARRLQAFLCWTGLLRWDWLKKSVVELGDAGGLVLDSSRGILPHELLLLPLEPYCRPAGRAAPACAICLCAYREGQYVRKLLPCGHTYHAGCLDPWLRLSSTCPVCRGSVGRTTRIGQSASR